jgi:hypothetical protein
MRQEKRAAMKKTMFRVGCCVAPLLALLLFGGAGHWK